MSVTSPTTATSAQRSDTTPAGPVVALAALVLGVAARLVFFGIWHPDWFPLGNYERLAAIGEQWWTMHVFVGALGTVAAATALAVLVSRLCATRGAWLAAIGGAVSILGATLFAVGIAGEGVLYAALVDPDVLAPTAAASAVDAFAADAALSEIPIFTGVAVAAVGGLVQLVALWWSRALPLWLLVA
ncbi:hypothetical protein [Herbiconiux sp. L3-i23]|uniref:hypothetical protein n=1 Tax=Herbiconiux sp. L3-i23 TaxID=2905871 RepID=UPI00205784B9|nr:hypothetical protein [Herbiconiux sp. L3-i23]BDI21883.1 hypothetical protein L3i23_06590 [Herbiconiux sp. L3-i23]